MTTSTDIAFLVRQVLASSGSLSGIPIVWQRKGYDKTTEIVLVPHYSEGEKSVRTAVVMINCHVPDIFDPEAKSYELNLNTLNTLQKSVAEALRAKSVLQGTGISWEVQSNGQPINEPDHNEHFVSVTLYAYIRKD